MASKNKSEGKKKKSKTAIKMDKYFDKAGYVFSQRQLFANLLKLAMAISIIFYIIWIFLSPGYSILYYLKIFVFSAVLILPGFFIAIVLLFYMFTDLIIEKRKDSIEKVFPEYLHIVSANVRAGLPIDQALWQAIRPNFGILSKEIEIVSKKSMMGEDLAQSLTDFGKKYDSKTVKRSVNLIIEGIDAGSEVSDLLEDIALNIEDIEIKRQSMAANVTSYVIFITFAVIAAAPLLYAVVTQMLNIVSGMGSGNLSLPIKGAIKESDFFIFCTFSLFLSSTMASIIISQIRSGKNSEALKKMPLFWLVSISLYYLAVYLFGNVFSGLI